MTPLLLKIKGLNSFEEEQVIDFEKLSAHGLFGIFGPTGSGKTTIVDAITMALYDKMSRYDGERTRQCINANCKTMSVSLRFALRGAVYVAERSYKRKSAHANTSVLESIQSVLSRLYEKKPDGDVVLADQSNKMTDEVERLIGIKYFDFARSVILPQGKFSEFLLLDNKDRRKMLERIFRLSEYGEHLTKRINEMSADVKSQLGNVQSKLDVYGDISHELIETEKANLSRLFDFLSELKQKQEQDRLELARLKTVREIYDEYLRAITLSNQLQSGAEERRNKNIRLRRAEQANLVAPALAEADEAAKRLEQSRRDWEEQNNHLTAATQTETQIRAAYENALTRKEQNYPLLIRQEADLMQAIRLADSIKTMEDERRQLLKNFGALKENAKKQAQEKEQSETQFWRLQDAIGKLAQRKREIFVPQSIRQLVSEGCDLLRRLEEAQEQVNSRESEKLRAAEVFTLSESSLAQTETALRKANSDYENLLKHNPGSAEDFLVQNQKHLEMENDYNRRLELHARLIVARDKRSETEKSVLENESCLSQAAIRLSEAESIHKSAIDRLEERRHASAIYLLAADLLEDEACPVCGSRRHPYPATDACEAVTDDILFENAAACDTAAASLEAVRSERQKILIAFETNKQLLQAVETEIETLSGTLGKFEPNSEKKALLARKLEIAKLDKDLRIHAQSSKEIENYIWDLQAQKAAELEKRKAAQNRVTEAEERLKKTIEDCQTIETRLTAQAAIAQKEIRDGFLPSEFTSWHDKYIKYDTEREELDRKEETLHRQAEQVNRFRDDWQAKILETQTRISAITAQGQEKRQMIEQQAQELRGLTDAPDPNAALTNVQNEIKNLLTAFEVLDRKRAAASEEKAKFFALAAGLSKQFETMRELSGNQSAKLAAAMLEHQFNTRDEVLACRLELAVRNQLEKELAEAEAAVKTVNDNIARLEEKLRETRRDENMYDLREKEAEHEQRINDRGSDIENLTRQNAVTQERIIQMERGLTEVGALREKQKSLNDRYVLLADLTELFKGNRFVEFVARRQLKYITVEASVRLKEMTAGRYALELDQTDFVIRDDYNGGVRRSPVTLSGGETFMTSLCLALALSSKIQLKSHASMDFFFLDEGFGTLDQAVLDTVMNTLENLRSEKIRIGVITHVEELKSRLGAKLIVTPQEQGLHGTTVQVET